VLSTFSHKSYPKAPQLYLAKFDELNEIGLEAFTRKYDPYWDVPVVETLPQPVIELPEIDGKYRPRGSGKTSILNLAIAHIEQTTKEWKKEKRPTFNDL
jgi:hypothetical protein